MTGIPGNPTAVEAELLNTGTELLLGSVANTHLPWLARELFPLGIRIVRQTTVPDGNAIVEAMRETASRRRPVAIVTGGLGPTSDDLTRDALAELFCLELREAPSILDAIRARCDLRRIAFQQGMARQALVPTGAIPLPNSAGTAPGLYLPASLSGGTHWFLLPGPPRELHPMFENQALPLLRDILPRSAAPSMRIFRVTGMGETAVEQRIGSMIEAEGKIEVGYCARPNEVDFRLIGPPEELDRWCPRILTALGDHLFACNSESLEQVVVQMLSATSLSLSTAESCTGGLLANRITNVPGASAVFQSGLVTYSNEEKSRLLGVDPLLLQSNGAVSEPVARSMAEGLLHACGTDFALATTGIAGPGGGGAQKPVGLVFIALASKTAPTEVREFHFPADRETFKQLASQAALDLLRRALPRLPR